MFDLQGFFLVAESCIPKHGFWYSLLEIPFYKEGAMVRTLQDQNNDKTLIVVHMLWWELLRNLLDM